MGTACFIENTAAPHRMWTMSDAENQTKVPLSRCIIMVCPVYKQGIPHSEAKSLMQLLSFGSYFLLKTLMVGQWCLGKWMYVCTYTLISFFCGDRNVIIYKKEHIPHHGANMGPTLVLSAPDGPHVGPRNLAIRDVIWIPRIAACAWRNSSWKGLW